MICNLTRRKGQGMTEYIIIIAVVAVLSLVVVMKFGNQIRNLFVSSSTELSGGDGKVEDKMTGETGEKTKINEM